MRLTLRARRAAALATCAVGAACTPSPAPIAPATAALAPVVVPIEVYRHRIYLPARIAGSDPVTLILDNGASVSGVHDSVARALGVRQSKTAKLTGNGQSVMSIGLDPASFAYHGTGSVIPLHVSRTRDVAWMSARVTFPSLAPIETRLGLDMGTYSALRFYRPFVNAHRLSAAVPNGVTSFGFGLGGEFPVRLARVAHLAIGTLGVDGPVAELSLADSGATAGSGVDGTIGGAILSCFHVIVDYAHARLILEPNGQACASSDADMSGLVLDAGGPGFDTITVGHVIATTPAADAGFREGDRVMRVDGMPADSLGLLRVQSLFSQAAAYRVTIERNGSTTDLTLHTRPLI